MSDKKQKDLSSELPAGIFANPTFSASTYKILEASSSVNNNFPNPIYYSTQNDIDTFTFAHEILNRRNNELALAKERDELANTVNKHLKKIEDFSRDKIKSDAEITALKITLAEFEQKESVSFLLNGISKKAHGILLETKSELKEKFLSQQEINAYVVSADVRRSTELMLKARRPDLFSDFMTRLCAELAQVFKENFGVVDKFTGDGLLAFFPEFYSGEDAGFYALKASSEAQKAFDRIYKQHRSSFNCVLKECGLGVGIDFGQVHLVRMAGALTVVGQPVVYACRLGGAPAGKTYINQAAYDNIAAKYGQAFQLSEVDIDVKHEGKMICYESTLRVSDYKAKDPEWMTVD